MLVVSKISQAENRRRLLAKLRRLRIPLRRVVGRGGLNLQSLSWREFWKPCEQYFAADTRLVQRLNRLKSAWKELVRRDGYNTEARRYVVGSPQLVSMLKGERLW